MLSSPAAELLFASRLPLTKILKPTKRAERALLAFWCSLSSSPRAGAALPAHTFNHRLRTSPWYNPSTQCKKQSPAKTNPLRASATGKRFKEIHSWLQEAPRGLQKKFKAIP